MKKTAILITLTLILSLFLITSQALAGSADAVAAKGGPPGTGTPGPGKGSQNTPGAQATLMATMHANLHGKPQIFRGTISAVNSTSLTLTLGDGSSQTIGLTPDTRIHFPGPNNTSATLQIGMQVMVMAFTDQNNNLVARAVMMIPGQPMRVHRVGWVTAYTPGASITIQASDGNLYTFTLTAGTQILPTSLASQLAVGSRVTIIAPRVPSALGLTATGIVVHPAGSGAGSQPPSPTPTATP